MLEERAVRVVQISDTHIKSQPGSRIWEVDVDESLAAVLEHLKRRHWPADLMLATGDLVHDDGAPAYRRLQALLSPLGIPVYCLPGNHDNPAVLSEVLASGRIRRERHALARGWQFILLDSAFPGSVAGHLAEDELDFLERTLFDHPDRYAIVGLHHQPLPVGSYWLDTGMIDNAYELFAILDRYPQVRALIWGHIHQTFEARRGQLKLLGTPSTCVQFKPASLTAQADAITPGYRWFELYPDGSLITGVERLPFYP